MVQFSERALEGGHFHGRSFSVKLECLRVGDTHLRAV